MDNAHASKRKSVFAVFNEAFNGYRRYVVVLIILGLLGAALDGIGINAIVPLLSFLLGAGTPTDIISRAMMWLFALVHIPFSFRYLLGFIVILFLLRAAALIASAYVRGHINARYMTNEMSNLFRATMRSKWQFMTSQKGGYIQNTIFWDVKRTAQLLDGIVQFIQASTASIMYLAVAFNISWQITLLTLVFGAAILLALRRPLITRMRVLGEETSNLEKTLAQHIIEYLQGFKTVKAAGAVGGVNSEASGYLDLMRQTYAKTVFLQGVGGVFVQPLSFLFIIGVFALSYHEQTLNLAVFAATLYLIQKIFSSLDSTQAFFTASVQLIPFAENVAQYKDTIATQREEEAIGGKSFTFKREIEFKDISLSYPSGTKALSDASFLIPKGALVGIIGGSGGGKTSLADLLLRLFKPTKGEILVDGVDAQEIRLADWRKKIAYVSQEAFLVNASIAHNIRFYDESVTEEDIQRAAKEARIYEDIMRLPQGFDTVVGDRGVTLSGGQRQRISLARALSRRPEVLVLDEVTSALDSELERQIQEVIDDLHGKVTIVVIAHRVSTVLGADMILVLDRGRVADQGAPQKMLANPESYLSKIVALQGRGHEHP